MVAAAIVRAELIDGELGYPMDFGENEKTLTRFGTNRKGAGMTESSGALLLEERSKAGELKGAEGRMGELMGDPQEPRVNGTAASSSASAAPTCLIQNQTYRLVELARTDRAV